MITACLAFCLLLSFILVQHYINAAGGFIEKWCGRSLEGAGKRDCTSVLDNPMAKVKGVPHVDIGIVYFSGSLLALWLLNGIPWLVSLFGLIAVAYCIYSIFVQKFLIGKWCTLCLLVQLIIAFQALIIITYHKKLTFLPTDFEQFIVPVLVFLSSGIVWYFLRQYWVERSQAKSNLHPLLSAKSLASFRKNKGKFAIEPLEGDLVCGASVNKVSRKKDSPWRVVIAIAPSCTHCGEFLESMLSLIEQERLPIHLRIRFVVIGLDDDQDGINDQIVTETVMALAANGDHEYAIDQLRGWYQKFNGKNVQPWLADIREIDDNERNLSGIYMADNSFWLQEKEVDETPTVFIEEQRIDARDSIYAIEILRKLCAV